MANGFGIARNFRQRSWPRLREYNTLLKVATPIPASVLDGDRWLAGIDFDPVGLLGMDCWSPACDDEDAWDDILTDAPSVATFLPVELRTASTCSTIGLDINELKDRMDATAAAAESTLLTQLLVGNGDQADCWPNPTILGEAEGTAQAIGSVIYALDAAVARMEDQLATDLGDALGTIFMTPGQLGLLQNRGGLVFEDGCWWTPTGTAIVADGGVTGSGAEIDPDAPGADGAFQWIYGTGPVWVHRGPASYTPDVFDQVSDDGGTHLLPRNIVRFMSRRMAIAVFDPAVRYRIAAGYASSVFVS